MEQKNQQLKDLKKLAREKLLGDEYGKYDYVEDLLGQQYILQTKPRMIRDRISDLLQIPKEELNYDTFMSWLRNYKKRAAKLNQDSSTLKNENKVEENISDPSDFTPMDPAAIVKKNRDEYLNNLIKVAIVPKKLM